MPWRSITIATPLATWRLRGIRPAGVTLVAIGIVFLGAALVITRGSPASVISGRHAFGDLLILLGAICWVVYTLGSHRFPGWSALRFTALTCALGMIPVSAITALLTWAGYLHVPSARDLIAIRWHMTYLVVLPSVIAVLAWNSGIRKVGPLNATLTANLVPVTVFVIGALRGQRFQPVEIAGALMVVGALVVNNVYLRRRGRQQAQRMSSHSGPSQAFAPHHPSVAGDSHVDP